VLDGLFGAARPPNTAIVEVDENRGSRQEAWNSTGCGGKLGGGGGGIFVQACTERSEIVRIFNEAREQEWIRSGLGAGC